MDTLLVANRGEIALRIMRTAARLGVRTVAVFTDEDADAPHVRAADRAVRIPGYLDVEAVVAAALTTGADAVHPGYGFLSERAALPRALAAAGVGWVGPPAEVVELLGRKDVARAEAVAAGLDVVPSRPLVPTGRTAGELRFPVLVKAGAGGGGKGMRVVRSAEEYDEAVAAAGREAAAAFGDDTLLVEALVERGRHVEVQVLADAHGHVVHLFERDCSSQRRHQKVVEEAPGPTVDAALRERLTSGAVALARRVGYVGAGTVEFLVDEATGAAYFLEVNTRLQVEHAVTEAVVSTGSTTGGTGSSAGGIDLVELQLRIADGEELGLAQGDLTLRGHAIEARVYAEDAFGGFLPQAGTAIIVRWPTGAGIRVEQALESGQVVGTAYDPMLAKIVASGPDRETARRRLVAALDETAVLGLTTNVGFLRALLETPEFRAATLDTAWLDRHALPAPDPGPAGVVAAWTDGALVARTGGDGPWRADGWRLGGPAAPVRSVLDRPRLVHRGTDTAGTVTDGDVVHEVREHRLADHVVVLDVDGERVWAALDVTDRGAEVVLRGQRFVLDRPDVTATTAAPAQGRLTAPMPGTVTAVDVAVGDRVEAGQRLGVLEAMKMELAVRAPSAGRVTVVGASVGGRVALGARLFVVEDE